MPIVYIWAWQPPPLQPARWISSRIAAAAASLQARAAIFLGDQHREVAGLRQCIDEALRDRPSRGRACASIRRELRAQFGNGVADIGISLAVWCCLSILFPIFRRWIAQGDSCWFVVIVKPPRTPLCSIVIAYGLPSRLASMDFRQLRTFSCVAELGSLSKASDTLRVAQPALRPSDQAAGARTARGTVHPQRQGHGADRSGPLCCWSAPPASCGRSTGDPRRYPVRRAAPPRGVSCWGWCRPGRCVCFRRGWRAARSKPIPAFRSVHRRKLQRPSDRMAASRRDGPPPSSTARRPILHLAIQGPRP